MGWIRASERVENLLTFLCFRGVHYEARYELWECITRLVTRLNSSPVTSCVTRWLVMRHRYRYEVARNDLVMLTAVTKVARNDPVTVTMWLVTTS